MNAIKESVSQYLVLDRVVATAGCCGIENRRAVRAAVKRGISDAGYVAKKLTVDYNDSYSHSAKASCVVDSNGMDAKRLEDLEKYISEEVSWGIHNAVWNIA